MTGRRRIGTVYHVTGSFLCTCVHLVLCGCPLLADPGISSVPCMARTDPALNATLQGGTTRRKRAGRISPRVAVKLFLVTIPLCSGSHWAMAPWKLYNLLTQCSILSLFRRYHLQIFIIHYLCDILKPQIFYHQHIDIHNIK